MTEPVAKVILCGIRTIGILGLVAVTWWGARYVGWTYDDTRTVLGIVNNYGPELAGVMLFGMNGYIFYQATRAPNDFSFVHFFMEGKAENLYRLGYWLFAQVGVWAVVAMYWRDKLDTAFMVGVLGVFVGERAINSWAHHRSKANAGDRGGDSGGVLGGGVGAEQAKPPGV